LIAVMLMAMNKVSVCGQSQQKEKPQPEKTFRGGLNQVNEQEAARPVRNDVAQAGEEMVTLRYFKIKKGTFEQFLKASVEGVWPYFEKLGSRVIGIWQVFTPTGVDGVAPTSKDYDEVYLSTRYASLKLRPSSRTIYPAKAALPLV
jgi:hypothetical protein